MTINYGLISSFALNNRLITEVDLDKQIYNKQLTFAINKKGKMTQNLRTTLSTIVLIWHPLMTYPSYPNRA